MPRDDDSSEWSEDGIPAIEILNYDLNNVGLKKLFEPDKVGPEPALSSSSGISSQSSSTFHDKSSTKQDKNVKQTTTEDNETIKIRYKIGYLPPPDVDPSEKPPMYDDHIHFLKHASNKSKAVRKNSIRNVLFSPDNTEGDNRSQSDLQADGRMNSSMTNTTVDVRSPPAPGFTSSKQAEDISEYSDDETPAVEILNYDLINIGLKHLYDGGEDEKVQEDTDLQQPSNTSVAKGSQSSVQSRQNSIKPTNTTSKLNSVSKESESKSNEDDSSVKDDSSYSEEGIPAVEILNYDLINIGLKEFHDDSKPKESDEKKSQNQGTKEVQVEKKTAPICQPEKNKAVQNDESSSEDESIVSQTEEDQSSQRTDQQDESSEHSEGETPAIEILNYDLINIGLKKLNGDDEPVKEPTTKNDSTATSRNQSNNQKAPVSVNPSTANEQVPDDNEPSESSNDEIPAVEILNYDLNNAGLKEILTSSSDTTSQNTNGVIKNDSAATSRNQGNSTTATVPSKQMTTKEQVSDDDEPSERSNDEIPAVEILNYDLNNAGLKDFFSSTSETPSQNPEGGVKKDAAATTPRNQGNNTKDPVPSNQISANEEPSEDDEPTETSNDEIPAVEILNYDLNNVGLKELYSPTSDIPCRNPEQVSIKPAIDTTSETSDDGRNSNNTNHALSKKEPAINGFDEEPAEFGGNDGNNTSDDVSETSTDEIPAVEILNYDLIEAGTKKYTEVNELHSEYPVNDIDKTVDVIRTTYQNIPPSCPNTKINEDESKTSHILSDEMSQQTRDSSLPDSHFEDYGHFLSVAQKKEKSLRQGRTTADNGCGSTMLSSVTPSESETNISSNEISKPSTLQMQNISSDTMNESLPVLRDESKAMPTTTTTTTTIETRTKTIVEPDGTTVTTTIITTRTLSKVTNDPRPEEPCLHSSEKIDAKENAAPDTRKDADHIVNNGISTDVIGSNDNVELDEPKKQMSSPPSSCQNEITLQKPLNEPSMEHSNLELGGDTIRMSNLVKANQELPRDVSNQENASDQGSEERSKYVGNNTQRSGQPMSTSDTENEISNAIGETDMSVDFDDYLGPNESVDFDIDDESCSQRSETGQIMKEMEAAFSYTTDLHGGEKNQSNAKYNSTGNFSKSKGIPLFEDHGDFLSEAASLRSGIDLKSIVEEEKRNDEIAKRKILSFGVSLNESCPISPLPSPNSTPSKNSSAVSGKPMTCGTSNVPIDDSESEFSDSEWSNAIPAKEILNYDLNNVGLKDLPC